MEDTRGRKGAPIGLWIVGALVVAGGLIARNVLLEQARDDARVTRMFNDMTGGDTTVTADTAAADVALWAVGIGVLLLAVALTVTLIRR